MRMAPISLRHLNTWTVLGNRLLGGGRLKGVALLKEVTGALSASYLWTGLGLSAAAPVPCLHATVVMYSFPCRIANPR